MPTQADYRSRCIQLVDITDILQNISESVDAKWCDVEDDDDLWATLFRWKSKDGWFGLLCDILCEGGSFDNPIVIDVRDSGWRMGNGHHRLAAAVFCGVNQIEVLFSNDYMGRGISDVDEDDTQCCDDFDNLWNLMFE